MHYNFRVNLHAFSQKRFMRIAFHSFEYYAVCIINAISNHERRVFVYTSYTQEGYQECNVHGLMFIFMLCIISKPFYTLHFTQNSFGLGHIFN